LESRPLSGKFLACRASRPFWSALPRWRGSVGTGSGFTPGETAMSDLARKPCSECGGRLRPRTIAQEFEREGIRIRVSGIRAWVCSRCAEVYFLPGGAGRLAKAARSLFELALAGRQHRGKLTARIT
jgi:YgiT-type zinc finger domain-containing protein